MYRHTQIGWGILGVFAVLLVIEIIGFLGGIGMTTSETLSITLAFIALMVCFSTLTVTVDDTRLQLKYGLFGFPRKTVKLSELASCRTMKSLWFALSLGIHYGFGGWLYNVSGPHAVELTFKNGKRLLVGTDEPEKLRNYLEEKI